MSVFEMIGIGLLFGVGFTSGCVMVLVIFDIISAWWYWT